ncbi:protein AMBP-like [Melanotaenia boesemani]|uniref:protein AMBP-like n=1 Tax=Melanotaenia boesemani TaxID=1250792 RepID=UPI001C055A1B|nr:protein AMBP-like [Melanotaenia boesemani]
MGLLPLLVLGLIWTLLAAPVIQQSRLHTQENFDLEQFMGRWYEVAVVSTCPHYMQRKKENPVIVTLDLKYVLSQGNFTMTSSSFRNGLCKETSTDYHLTNTSGQFFHHVTRFGADVDTFVVQFTNEHAMLLQLGTEKPSGIKTTTGKLYSRTMTANPSVLDQFKAVVKQYGMSEDGVIINQPKGECVPGKLVKESPTQLAAVSHSDA